MAKMKMTREQIIEKLVDHDFELIQACWGRDESGGWTNPVLSDVLEEGHKGFRDYGNDELVREYLECYPDEEEGIELVPDECPLVGTEWVGWKI